MKFDRSQFISKYVSETRDNIRRLNDLALEFERRPGEPGPLGEMMRVTHTIKGSSRMLNLRAMGDMAHALEDALNGIQKSNIPFKGTVPETVFQTLDTLGEMLDEIAQRGDCEADITLAVKALQAVAANQLSQLDVASRASAPPPPVSTITTRAIGRGVTFDKSAFVTRFVEEAEDHIRQLNGSLERLEAIRDHAEALQSALRAAHTLKGSARMMKFENLGNVAQRVEAVFVAVKDKRIRWDNRVHLALSCSLQLLEDLKRTVARTGEDAMANTAALDRLDEIAAGGTPTEQQIRKAFERKEEPAPGSSTEPDVSEADIVDRLGERLVQARLIAREQLIHVNQTTDAKVPLGERLIALGYISREQLNRMLKEQRASRAMLGHVQTRALESVEEELQKGVTADQLIRVQVDKIDGLIRDVGELATNQLRHQMALQDLRRAQLNLKSFMKALHKRESERQRRDMPDGVHADAAVLLDEGNRAIEQFERVLKILREDSAQRDVLSNQIQHGVMGMRMIPISTIFDAYPRAVRDLAKTLGKEVRLVIEGGETELDRKMVEKLNEPLIHLIRNAIDHGIETPDERVRRGKPHEGVLRIGARNEGSSIVIEIEEDGRGIDFDRIKAKAVEKRLIAENEDINRFSENDLINLIFMPGFSTNDFITDISGRGYGMDVVKQCVETLKGYIAVDSRRGTGSRFAIHLPLTLTALRALFVKVGPQVFALPVSSVTETLQIRREEIIQVVDKNAVRLRNQLIPVLVLSEVLGLPSNGAAGEYSFVVIAHAGSDRVGFLIDDIVDEKDIIVKSLPSHFSNLKNVSSAALAADNTVILILHVPDLILSTKDFTMRERPEVRERVRQSILVVDDSLNTREVEKTILQAYGYQVDTAKDGLDALEKLGQKRYDLVVTDLEMPAMDGFTLTARIKEDKTYEQIPVVIVTSRDSADDKRRGIEVGANAYIVKGSFDQTNLIDTVESLIG